MQLLEKVNKKLLMAATAGILLLGLLTGLILWLFTPEPPLKSRFRLRLPVITQTGYYAGTSFGYDEQGYLTCMNRESRLGIDVSGFQGQIDWDSVAQAGIEFVFIRVGGRGTTQGSLYTDDYAQGYYEGAKAAGLEVGAYFFSQAITPEEAREEAQFVLEQIDGWVLELPVVYDWEWVSSDSRTADLSGEMLTACTFAFCQQIESGGYDPMIYFNVSQGLEMLSLKALSQYPFWLAWYDDTLEFPHRVDYWQYSCTGSVPGIEGDVDLNLHFPEA